MQEADAPRMAVVYVQSVLVLEGAHIVSQLIEKHALSVFSY